jgi:hypothetical protein
VLHKEPLSFEAATPYVLEQGIREHTVWRPVEAEIEPVVIARK